MGRRAQRRREDRDRKKSGALPAAETVRVEVKRVPDPASLPDDPAVLREMICELIAELRRHEQNETILRQKVGKRPTNPTSPSVS